MKPPVLLPGPAMDRFMRLVAAAIPVDLWIRGLVHGLTPAEAEEFTAAIKSVLEINSPLAKKPELMGGGWQP